jgi:hypothetical protein
VTTDLKAVEQQARALIAQRQFAEAEALLRTAMAGGKAPVALWQMLGACLRSLGRAQEARPIQEMLVDALPGELSMRFDLAETALLLGDFDRGWREYHYRYQLPHTTRIERKVQKPRWDGRPIPGKTLLIHDEQGFGDTFQFMRMVAWAKARSQARVILEINQEGYGLAKRMGGFDEITVRGALPPAFDQHCEMMSLPMSMGLQLSDLPGQPMPYLTPDPARVEHWRQHLAPFPGPRVALVWAGRPTHLNDANRSMSLETLAPLAAAGVTFMSIQKGPTEGVAATPPPGMNLVNLSPHIRDFEDTAAILYLSDLLISVDSSPVHLAGALGKSAWVMLPFVPDWRWLLNRADTPWYPTVRLFRQTQPGDWAGVAQTVADELARQAGALTA